MTKCTASTATTIDELATGHNTEDHVDNSPNREGKSGKEGKRPVTKAKLRSIMEAASALTALGDEEEAEADGGNQVSRAKEDKEDCEDTLGKRYIPEHKKPDAALTFPEKLMSMMKMAEKEDTETFCIAWLPDGKSFVIRNPDEFTRTVLPHYFKATKFSSYTRKLYRWGFRQVNRGIGPDDPIIFGNEYFQRDNAELMVKMRSITAAGTRKAHTIEKVHQHELVTSVANNKRALDMNAMNVDDQRKRMLFEHMLQQHKFGGMQVGVPNQQNLLEQQATLQQFNLAAALRPPIGINHQVGFKQLGAQHFNQNPLGLYMASQPQQQQRLGFGHLPAMPQNQLYNSTSTAEIVNAAINALRFAS